MLDESGNVQDLLTLLKTVNVAKANFEIKIQYSKLGPSQRFMTAQCFLISSSR